MISEGSMLRSELENILYNSDICSDILDVLISILSNKKDIMLMDINESKMEIIKREINVVLSFRKYL